MEILRIKVATFDKHMEILKAFINTNVDYKMETYDPLEQISDIHFDCVIEKAIAMLELVKIL